MPFGKVNMKIKPKIRARRQGFSIPFSCSNEARRKRSRTKVYSH
jgi:hypothetical protein